MTDLTEGKRFDRVSGTWLDADEYERRRAEWEERAFQRRANQGDLCTPMVIHDGMKPVQSMTNGRMYDSKSAIRQEYKRAGVVEVGTDVPKKRSEPSLYEKKKAKEARKASIAKALSYCGFGAP